MGERKREKREKKPFESPLDPIGGAFFGAVDDHRCLWQTNIADGGERREGTDGRFSHHQSAGTEGGGGSGPADSELLATPCICADSLRWLRALGPLAAPSLLDRRHRQG